MAAAAMPTQSSASCIRLAWRVTSVHGMAECGMASCRNRVLRLAGLAHAIAHALLLQSMPHTVHGRPWPDHHDMGPHFVVLLACS